MKLIDILVEELPKRGGWPKRANCITQDPDKRVEPATCQPGVAKFNPGCWHWFLNSSRIGGFSANILASDYATAIITRQQYEAALAAKNDGWIDWGGGECPVEEGALVDVKYRDGAIKKGLRALIPNSGRSASRLFWVKDNLPTDIFAYRLHQPQEAEQAKADDEADLNECIGQGAAQVWNGEGLPLVGCECEYLDSNTGWYPVTIKYASNQIVVICGTDKIFGEELEIARDVQLDKPQFRPISTEAERKRDAIISIIDKAYKECPHSEAVPHAIYEAIAEHIR